MSNENNNEYLTPTEVAELLKWNVKTVWDKCRKGEIPHIAINKRCYRIRVDEFNEWIAKKSAQSVRQDEAA
jgi:excisionase family DNA binding protein